MHEIIICHIHIKLRQGQNDLATFIDAMKLTHDFTGPWIAFGGSYPGSMAAWVREKYPHLIQGSVSSSGPLLAKVKFLLGKSMRNSKMSHKNVSIVNVIYVSIIPGQFH